MVESKGSGFGGFRFLSFGTQEGCFFYPFVDLPAGIARSCTSQFAAVAAVYGFTNRDDDFFFSKKGPVFPGCFNEVFYFFHFRFYSFPNKYNSPAAKSLLKHAG